MKITTVKFALLILDAQEWDECHQAMCHAQTEWLLDNFVFGDHWCVYANPIDREKWNVP